MNSFQSYQLFNFIINSDSQKIKVNQLTARARNFCVIIGQLINRGYYFFGVNEASQIIGWYDLIHKM